MTSSSQKSPGLAQEIYDEFLLCKICFASYKNPKSLNCLHVFCLKCIDDQFKSKSSYKLYADYREITCPLCYRRTPLPPGGATMLPDNFTVAKLLALIGPECSTNSSQAPSCSICSKISEKHRDAVSKCLDCSKFLCGHCEQEHRETKVTSTHSLFGIEVEKEVQCKEHSDEAIRFYCTQCDDCICVLCTFNQKHRDHSLIQFSEAVSNCRLRLDSLLSDCRKKTRDCEERIEAINRCEHAVTMTTQKIKDTANRLTQEVRQAEAKLQEELHRMVGTEVMQRLETKTDLVTFLEGMRSTCDIADIIVSGKDMELLLLKKDVESKLSSINAIQFPELPPKHITQMQFSPGEVNVGCLHDDGMTSQGCSGSMKSRNIFKNPSGILVPSRDSAVQTEEEAVMTSRTNTGVMTERGGGGEGEGGNVHSQKSSSSTLPVMTVSVRVSPPKIKADQSDQEPRRRRRRRDASQTKIGPQSVSSGN